MALWLIVFNGTAKVMFGALLIACQIRSP